MREEAGLTQQQLADLVGISQAHVAKIENEKVNPRLSTINRIISVLKTNNKIKSKDFVTRDVIFAGPEDTIDYISKLMREKDISQIPVWEKENVWDA